MSIRELALELYRMEKQVEILEKKFQDQNLSMAERSEIGSRLRQHRTERDRLRTRLEAAKKG